MLLLIFSSHLRLGLPSEFLPSVIPTKILQHPPVFPAHATSFRYPALLYLIIIIFDGVYISTAPHHAVSSHLLSLPYSHVKIFSSALCSQTPSSSLGVRVQVLRQDKTTDEDVFLYILIFMFVRVYGLPEDERYELNGSQ
jgi:hypothetical protein